MPFISRALRLIIEYVLEFEFGGFLKSRINLRALGPHRRLGWIAVALALALVAATPLLYYAPFPLSRTEFQDARDRTYSTPMAAVYLTLAGMGTGWGFVLAGAAHAGAAAYAAAALLYVYLVTAVGFGLGRSPWLAIPPLLVLPVVAASPLYRRSPRARLLLAAAALFGADIALRTTGVNRHLGPLRGLGWIPAGLVLAVLADALGRRRAWTTPALVGLASGATLLFMAAAASGNPREAAGWANVSLVSVVGLLSVLWFLLGGNLVDGAAALTRFVRTVLRELVPRRFSAMGDRVILTGLGAMFAYLTYRAWKAQTGALPEEVEGAWAMGLFTFTIAWDLLTKTRDIPEEGWKGWPAPGPLLFYLGVTLILVSAFHFHMVGRLTFTLHEMFLAQLSGAAALVIPYVLYRGLYWQRWVAPPPSGLVLRAFLLGAVASLPAYALRMALRPGAVALSGPWIAVVSGAALGALSALAVALWPWLSRADDVRAPAAAGSAAPAAAGGSPRLRPLDAAVAAAAAGIGLAVFFLEGVSIHVTTTALTLAGSLFRLTPLRRAAVTLQESYLSTRETTTPEVLVIAMGGTLAVLLAAMVTTRGARPRIAAVGETQAVQAVATRAMWIAAALAVQLAAELANLALLTVLPADGPWLVVAAAVPAVPTALLIFRAARDSRTAPTDAAAVG
ncbi:MAG: hypothetical protein HY660_06455 [Armatimonadetes bacterium]|nr:hypothetical protein [Armatimonadota bacterium]